MVEIIAKHPKRKEETVIELAASAEKLYTVFKDTTFHIPGHAPDHIKGVEVHEGGWGKHGSVKEWTYTIEGKTATLKERVEYDDAKMMVKKVAVDGDPLTYYKHFEIIYQFAPKGTGCVETLTIVYEKINENIKGPDYLDFLTGLFQSISEGVVKG